MLPACPHILFKLRSQEKQGRMKQLCLCGETHGRPLNHHLSSWKCSLPICHLLPSPLLGRGHGLESPEASEFCSGPQIASLTPSHPAYIQEHTPPETQGNDTMMLTVAEECLCWVSHTPSREYMSCDDHPRTKKIVTQQKYMLTWLKNKENSGVAFKRPLNNLLVFFFQDHIGLNLPEKIFKYIAWGRVTYINFFS